MRRQASVRVFQGLPGASVLTACRVTGASPSADRVTVMATVTTATLRLDSVRAAETSLPDTTVRGRTAQRSPGLGLLLLCSLYFKFSSLNL